MFEWNETPEKTSQILILFSFFFEKIWLKTDISFCSTLVLLRIVIIEQKVEQFHSKRTETKHITCWLHCPNEKNAIKATLLTLYILKCPSILPKNKFSVSMPLLPPHPKMKTREKSIRFGTFFFLAGQTSEYQNKTLFAQIHMMTR